MAFSPNWYKKNVKCVGAERYSTHLKNNGQQWLEEVLLWQCEILGFERFLHTTGARRSAINNNFYPAWLGS